MHMHAYNITSIVSTHPRLAGTFSCVASEHKIVPIT